MRSLGIYIFDIVLILVGGIVFLDLFRGKTAKKLYFSIVTIQLALVAGLRGYTVGGDTMGYVWYFQLMKSLKLKDIIDREYDIEKGYMMLEYLVSKFTEDPTVFFLIVAVFFIGSISRLIYRNSSEACLSYILFVCLGFYSFSLSGMRQTVALGIIFFAFEFIKQRKLLPFLAIVIISSLVHTSALIFLPAYFIAYKKLTKPYLGLVFLTIIFSFVFKESLFEILSKFSGYGYTAYDNDGPYKLIMLMILILLGGIIQMKSVLRRNPDNLIYYNMAFVAITLGMLTFVNPSALRAAYYYYIYFILFIPEILFSISDRKLRMPIYYICLVIVIYLEFKALPASPVVPYKLFWETPIVLEGNLDDAILKMSLGVKS